MKLESRLNGTRLMLMLPLKTRVERLCGKPASPTSRSAMILYAANCLLVLWIATCLMACSTPSTQPTQPLKEPPSRLRKIPPPLPDPPPLTSGSTQWRSSTMLAWMK